MDSRIEIRSTQDRGCGRRKISGLYLVANGNLYDCGKLPIPLVVCPTCGCGIKQSRGWTWIDVTALSGTCKQKGSRFCIDICPLSFLGRIGLLWIGEQFYDTPNAFNLETEIMGESRRIHRVPRGFSLGKTWVGLAHRKAICKKNNGIPIYTPGIFRLFKPQRIEVICSGTESAEIIDGYIKRGFTPVIDVYENQSEINLEGAK